MEFFFGFCIGAYTMTMLSIFMNDVAARRRTKLWEDHEEWLRQFNQRNRDRL